MKYQTNKQRKAVYEKVAERIQTGIGDEFLCGNLAQVIYPETFTLYKIGEGLPEFDLFEPTKEEKLEYMFGLCWFGNNLEGMEERVTVMLLCAAMCNLK